MSDPLEHPAMWLVPHTHWDREWYEPHDVFRARLVTMIDGLLDLLEAEPDYRFTLDGQAAAVDDYLEIRPENRARLDAAVHRGQLSIGPWLILHDEFTCDGETAIRNLEIGIERSRAHGGEMRLGYLPDMFGHAAQTPQILSGFGLKDSSLWRGVPIHVDKDAFLWRALNGDAVRVEYLWDGYGNALKLFEPLSKMPDLVRDYLEATADRRDGRAPAGMYGTDHMFPRHDLARIVREHNATHPDIPLRIATLDEVVASRDHTAKTLSELPVVDGEMRSHALGNILPGVLSIRTNIKAAMAASERALTVAERLDALVGGRARTSFFERGWYFTVESSAHDSAPGCGVDDTAAEVEERLHVAEQTARGAIDIAGRLLARRVGPDSVVLVNPSGWDRDALVETVVDGDATECAEYGQVIDECPTVIGDEWMTTEHLPRILRRIHGQELFGKQIVSWEFTGERELTFTVARSADGLFDLDEFTRALHTRMAMADTQELWHVLTTVPPSTKLLLSRRVAGGAALRVDTTPSALAVAPALSTRAVEVSGTTMGNGRIRVRVDARGRVDIEDLVSGRHLHDALRLVDEGDRGDSYNFGHVDDAPIVDPTRVVVHTEERGPLRGRIRISWTYVLPERLSNSDRAHREAPSVEQRIDALLELRAGEPFCRVEMSLVNSVSDHRLRVHVSTFQRECEGSVSAGQYGVTSRGRTSEEGWGEAPIPTYPATRFVSAGGVAVHTDRLMEYEVVTPEEGEDRIALTLVRAVGLMSVNIHPLRDEPAGSECPVPGAQYLGVEVRTRFAIDLSCTEWDDSDIVRHADLFRFEPLVIPGEGSASVGGAWSGDSLEIGTDTSMPDSLVSVEGRVALESLRRLPGGVLEARFVNYHHHDEPLRATARGVWDRTNLAGDVIAEAVPLGELTVPASTILTLRRRVTNGEE